MTHRIQSSPATLRSQEPHVVANVVAGAIESALELAGNAPARHGATAHRALERPAGIAGQIPGFGAISSDPMLILRRLQMELRDRNTEIREGDVITSKQEAETAQLRRQEAIEKAQEAADSALGFLDLPDWLETTVKLAVVGATVAATVGTGGLAAGLAIAGGALLLAGEVVDDVAVELGMSEQDAQWLALGCQITGSLLLAGSGFAAGAASAAEGAVTVSEAASTVEQITQAVQGAQTALNGARTVGRSVYSNQAEEAQADAEGQRLRGDRATQRMEDATSEMRELLQQFSRMGRRFRAAMDAAAETKLAATRRLA